MERFFTVYGSLNSSNLELLDEIYAENIVFIDPAHTIRGLDRLRAYFAAMYANLDDVAITFTHHQRTGDIAYVEWRMIIRHPRLNRGREVVFDGVSRLEFDAAGKVHRHRDYFDLGAMLYENLPVLGWAVKTIKKRLGQ